MTNTQKKHAHTRTTSLSDLYTYIVNVYIYLFANAQEDLDLNTLLNMLLLNHSYSHSQSLTHYSQTDSEARLKVTFVLYVCLESNIFNSTGYYVSFTAVFVFYNTGERRSLLSNENSPIYNLNC